MFAVVAVALGGLRWTKGVSGGRVRRVFGENSRPSWRSEVQARAGSFIAPCVHPHERPVWTWWGLARLRSMDPARTEVNLVEN